jgi:hypothetical protein
MGGNVTARQIHEFLTRKDTAHYNDNGGSSSSSSSSKSMTTTLLYIKRLCASGLVAKSPCSGTRCGRWTYSIAGSYPERNVVVATVAAPTAA